MPAADSVAARIIQLEQVKQAIPHSLEISIDASAIGSFRQPRRVEGKEHTYTFHLSHRVG
jgi:hypothetical protein